MSSHHKQLPWLVLSQSAKLLEILARDCMSLPYQKKTQSEDIQVPAVELCWSHSTPKDCLLNLGTDTNRDLFPLALHSTTGSKLEPSLHISWVKWPSWRYTLRREERGSLSPPFAHSENTWDLRTATEEEIKDCPSCWEHEIMLCFMSARQSRKWHWEAQ